MHNEIESFESPELTPLDFSLCGWMNNEVYTRKVDTRNKLLGRILDAVARMKKGEDQPRRKTRDLRTRGAECIEFYTGIFEHLLRSVTLQMNQLTRCNNFSSLLLDVYLQLNMFRAFSRPSSGTQQLQ